MKLILCGPLASGKTTLARMMVEAMGKRPVLITHVREISKSFPEEIYLPVLDNVELGEPDLAAIDAYPGNLIVTVRKDSPVLDDCKTPVFRLQGIAERRRRQVHESVFV